MEYSFKGSIRLFYLVAIFNTNRFRTPMRNIQKDCEKISNSTTGAGCSVDKSTGKIIEGRVINF